MDNNYHGHRSVIEILHEQIVRNNQAEAEKHNPCKFYPSSVGKCLRAIVYQMQGYQGKPVSSKGLLIMENGTYYHERTEKLFGTTGLLIAPEVSIRVPELRISGRSDAIIKNFFEHTSSDNIVDLYIEETKEDGTTEQKNIYHGPDNDVIIVELKSINDSGFEYVKKTGPKEAHIMQLQLYMHLTGIKQGILLYENKNNQEMREYFLGYDPNMANLIIEKARKANQHVDEKTLPAKEFEKSDKECMWCDYRDFCWPTENTCTIADAI